MNKYGVGVVHIASILDDYLDEKFGEDLYYNSVFPNSYSNDTITIKVMQSDGIIVTDNDVVEKIYELLSEEIPVIYSADKKQTRSDETDDSQKSGHVMVAYDTIEGEEDIDFKMHKGWIDDPYVNFSDTEYDSNIGILWLEINESQLAHSCNNNYVLETGGSVCSCQIYGEKHPEHEHEVFETYSTSATQHNYMCICGKNLTEPHNFTYTSINSLYHSATCTTCGYTYTEMHPGVNAVNKPRLCSKCQYVFVTFEPWEDETSEELE